MKNNKIAIGLLALALAGCGANTADTADAGGAGWKPRGNVTMIVPFGAGGGSDIAGRAMAGAIEKSTTPKVNISVENREGGSGAVGYSFLLSKKGDGNRLLATESALLTLPAAGNVTFTYKDFTPIMKIAEDGSLMVVPKASPYKTCAELVDAAKKARVPVGVAAAFGIDNFTFKMIEKSEGVEFQRVPTESGGELTTALLGNQIQAALLNPGEVVGQLRSGDLRALCATTDKRYEYPELKDIATAKEQGIDVSYANFRGILAPGGIPAEAKAYWIKAAQNLLKSPEYDKYVKDNYLQPVQAEGDQFTTTLEQLNQQITSVK
ncbi:tripartite tricarboxylate transporter substrate binding protein [Streptosporangium sp. KLBMP 9127]|nr:tripartite tricarboxylate transporter substrate binding protein [Streptosporangium sp. KLBMP 9127]